MCHRYHASLSDGTVVESRLEGDEFTFVTESGEVPEGLDQAVMSMKKGEVATFEVTAAYGYAAAGRAATAAGAAVPPDAALKYAITLVDFTNVGERMCAQNLNVWSVGRQRQAHPRCQEVVRMWGGPGGCMTENQKAFILAS